MPQMPIDILLMAPHLSAGGEKAGISYRLHEWASAKLPDPVARSIRGVVTNGAIGVPANAFDQLPNLELISVCGAGYDQIDLAACRERGIKVTTAHGLLSADVADMALALTLGVMRRVPEADRFVRAGKWAEGADFPLGTALSKKRMGIVGMGSIGLEIARRAEAFGMEIGYHNRRAYKEANCQYYPDLLSLADWADVLMLCLPGGPATKHIINASVLEAVGRDGFLVNVARGSVVDEDALISALQDGRLAGAGLDVFDDEPRIREEFLHLKNVVLQPHVGSATQETRSRMAELVYQNLDAQFSGQPLLTPLTF